jgi:hypothetical protein
MTDTFKNLKEIRENPDRFFSSIRQGDRKRPAAIPEEVVP